MTAEELKDYLHQYSLRKVVKKNKQNLPSPDLIRLPSSSYRNKQSYGKAMKRSIEALPSSPRKKAAVVSGLAEKVWLKIVDEVQKINHPNSVRKELHEIVKEFYFRPDISYTAPGMHDVMTIWDSDGKKKLWKYYLTMYLREAVIFEETIKSISFSLFCDLRPQNVLLLGNSPKDQCKCLTHENLFYKLSALGIEYSSDFWKDVLCDESPNSKCWLSQCENCKDGKKIQANDEYKYVDYKQWIEILVPKKKKDSDNKDNGDKEKVSKNLRIITERVERGVVLEKLKGDMTTILHHINTKKIQASEFNRDKTDPSKRVLQIDYAMAYTCEYQDEVQSALWGRGSVNLFTAALTH